MGIKGQVRKKTTDFCNGIKEAIDNGEASEREILEIVATGLDEKLGGLNCSIWKTSKIPTKGTKKKATKKRASKSAKKDTATGGSQ